MLCTVETNSMFADQAKKYGKGGLKIFMLL